MNKRAGFSALVVVTLGSLLHFAWQWSNKSSIVAVFAAVNESTWEHLKLAFWPALGLAPVQRLLYRTAPGLLLATVIRTLLPPALIVAIFYGYTGIIGTNYLPLDIGTFVVAVVAGEFAGHAVMNRQLTRATRRIALVLLAISVAAFSTLTFRHPAWFLFEDPVQRQHRNRWMATNVLPVHNLVRADLIRFPAGWRVLECRSISMG